MSCTFLYITGNTCKIIFFLFFFLFTLFLKTFKLHVYWVLLHVPYMYYHTCITVKPG